MVAIPIQTQIKHLILKEYLAKWRSIIINGSKFHALAAQNRGVEFMCRLVYVDGFSSDGRAFDDRGNSSAAEKLGMEHSGSPILGIRGLEDAKAQAARAGFDVQTMAILVEESRTKCKRLIENLRGSGFQERLIFDPAELSFRDSSIAIVHDDLNNVYRSIAQLLNSQYTKSFVFLDPYGPKDIPVELVSSFVGLPGTDVVINWPYLGLERKTGFLWSGPLTPGADAQLRNIDLLFGNGDWREICYSAILGTTEISSDKEAQLTELYTSTLQGVDPQVVVKRIPLEFESRDRTIYYLFITTRDPNGALELNQILDEAKLHEFGLKWADQQERYIERRASAGQQFLFELPPATPPTSEPRQVNIERVAADVYSAWHGKSASLKEVYGSLVNTRLYKSDINSALRLLLQQGLVDKVGKKVADTMQFKALDS